MGEYEPRDSRNVTLKQERAPGEPPRTGPQEAATRQPHAQQTELEQDESGEDAEQVREDAMEQDAEELDESLRRDRND
jgi:hypothetical protein